MQLFVGRSEFEQQPLTCNHCVGLWGPETSLTTGITYRVSCNIGVAFISYFGGCRLLVQFCNHSQKCQTYTLTNLRAQQQQHRRARYEFRSLAYLQSPLPGAQDSVLCTGRGHFKKARDRKSYLARRGM